MLSTFSGIGGNGKTWGPLGRSPGSCAANIGGTNLLKSIEIGGTTT
jgi:hypothetical protein